MTIHTHTFNVSQLDGKLGSFLFSKKYVAISASILFTIAV